LPTPTPMTSRVPTQRCDLPLLATAETCAGRTFIVTGANTGLGFEAAKHLVKLGAAKVIMAVRNVSAGEAAKTDIETSAGKAGIAEVWSLDLASYQSVIAFSNRAIQQLDRIDAVIENAGVAAGQRVLAEGHLVTTTVNVFGTFLLAVLLLPKLMETAKKFNVLPHVTIVSSGVSFDFEELWANIKDNPLSKMDDEQFPTMHAYPISKLLEVMAVRHLATLLPVSRTSVVINCCSPGLCTTSLSRSAPPEFKERIKKQHELYGRTSEQGSRTLLHGTVAGRESHGCFLDSCEIAENLVPSWVTEEDSRRIWEGIAIELEKAQPGCVQNGLGLP
ncbi:hypothetical protein jhhlp_000170, partial [Lomentospora prolificans]